MEIQEPRRALAWWSPVMRGILPLDALRVTRSMKQSAKRYEVRVDTCFADVMRGCGNPARKGAWITEDFIEAYGALHLLG
jgi:leucyl/phenylalanyl-tRNA--protein transferase